MTREEYREFLKDFRARFPELWGRIKATRKDTIRIYFKSAFKDLDLSDCMRVSRKLTHIGEVPQPGDVCHRYREECNRIQQREESQKMKHHSRGAWNEVTKGSMAAAYQKACSIIQEEKARGLTVEEAIEVMRNQKRREWSDLV